jgi:hypothetical protein
LRVLEHRILSVNLVLRLEVVGVGSGPVAIQGRSDVVVFHLDLPSLTPLQLQRRHSRCDSDPAHLAIGQPVDGENLSELPMAEIASTEPGLPMLEPGMLAANQLW